MNRSTCDNCGDPIPEKRLRKGARFCKDECRAEFHRNRFGAENPKAKYASPTVGTISELLVAADLLRNGFAVFRAMSPACDCDLIVMRGRKLCRVEVKTAYKALNSEKLYVSIKDRTLFDVLALVRHGQIQYEPDIYAYFDL